MNTKTFKKCITSGGRYILRADFPDKNEGQIILFRLLGKSDYSDIAEQEYYVAVPNGKSITLCNVPFSSFTLEVI